MASPGAVSRGAAAPMLPRRHVEAPPNPFEDPNEPLLKSPIELLKAVVFGVTLLPIRLLLSCTLLVISGLVCVVATIGFPVKEDRGCFYHSEPLPKWRRYLLAPAPLVVRALLFIFGFWHVKVTDRRKDKKAPVANTIVVAPHLTDLDVLMLYWAFPPLLSGVGDARILRVPFIKQVGLATQGIFVDLSRKESKAACKEVIDRRANASWTGYKTLVFPEGRITNGRVLIQFRTGAFDAGEPVQPVVLRYPKTCGFDPTGQSGANRSRLWPLRLLTQLVNSCEVEILDTFVPTERMKRDPVEYANSVRQRMAAQLGVQCTSFTYEDAALFREAVRGHISPEHPIAEYKQDLDHMVKHLKEFMKLDKDHDGAITEKEWRENGFPISFSEIDVNHDQKISFHEFVGFMLERGFPEHRAALQRELGTQALQEYEREALCRDYVPVGNTAVARIQYYINRPMPGQAYVRRPIGGRLQTV